MKNYDQPEGNFYNKYETQNPLEKIIMRFFFDSLIKLLDRIEFHNLHEVGCGEGYLVKYISGKYPDAEISASDLSQNKINEARIKMPQISFYSESVYSLPFPDNCFDLLVASEVLEHLEQPEKALTEILRVTNKYVLLSVPHEPIWRICNIVRGKYTASLGNTPGHIQHWSRKSFVQFVKQQCRINNYVSPFPWTMLLCEKHEN